MPFPRLMLGQWANVGQPPATAPNAKATAVRPPDPIRGIPSTVVDWPSMLLIGGTGRDSGKTRLCCALIEHFSQVQPVVGLKVTVIRESQGGCPRGNHECGVCTSLLGEYEISEEQGDPPGKDTSLMLNAGATRVFWLRVKREHLAQGTAALVERVGEDTLCICESNSLRHAVRPGVFLLVKAREAKSMKRSSREVAHLADRLVLSDSAGFDISSGDFRVRGAHWRLEARR